jgi:hypothetical protein
LYGLLIIKYRWAEGIILDYNQSFEGLQDAIFYDLPLAVCKQKRESMAAFPFLNRLKILIY